MYELSKDYKGNFDKISQLASGGFELSEENDEDDVSDSHGSVVVWEEK